MRCVLGVAGVWCRTGHGQPDGCAAPVTRRQGCAGARRTSPRPGHPGPTLRPSRPRSAAPPPASRAAISCACTYGDRTDVQAPGGLVGNDEPGGERRVVGFLQRAGVHECAPQHQLLHVAAQSARAAVLGPLTRTSKRAEHGLGIGFAARRRTQPPRENTLAAQTLRNRRFPTEVNRPPPPCGGGPPVCGPPRRLPNPLATLAARGPRNSMWPPVLRRVPHSTSAKATWPLPENAGNCHDLAAVQGQRHPIEPLACARRLRTWCSTHTRVANALRWPALRGAHRMVAPSTAPVAPGCVPWARCLGYQFAGS